MAHRRSSSSRGRSRSHRSTFRSRGRKYSRKAQREIRTEMHHKRSGKHRIKNRRQAIAIGLSKARRQGAKVPRRTRRSRSR